MTSNRNKKKYASIARNLTASVSIIASVGMVSTLAYKGYNAYADATKTPVIQSNYTDDAAQDFPASTFVEKMLSEPAPNTNGALTRIPIATANMLPVQCSQPDIPDAVVYARSASNADYSIVVQAYGAGQGHTNFDAYVKSLTSKCEIQIDDNTGSDMVKWSNGAIITMGDAIVSVTVNDAKKRDEIVDWVKNRMTSLLAETSCLSMTESSDDSTRSFYYDKDEYEGLKQSEQVSTSKNIINNAIPQSYTDNKGNVRAMYTSPQSRNAPESPLPKDIPASLPTMPTRPSFTSQPTTPDGTSTITYQVSDDKGPGCGWSWSGQKTPDYDNTKLNDNYKKTKDNAIAALDASVLAYNSAASNWSFDALWKTKFIAQWNAYVKQVQDIEAKWNEFDAKRAAFKPTWIAYINSVYNWELQKLDYDKTQDDWNNKIKQCVADKQAKWAADNSKSSMGSNAPTDEQKSKWQSECESENPKPSELNTPLPAEPSAPVIPTDITIPNSWQTANEAKSEADNAWNTANQQGNASNDNNASQSNGNDNSNHAGSVGGNSNSNGSTASNGSSGGTIEGNNGSVGDDSNSSSNDNSNGSIGGN